MIKSICFLTTYQCNAQCDHCECRPHVKDRISGEDLLRYIDEATALGTVGQVIFSGGEPTLLKEDLFRAISHASSKGLLTRVVTNGWWGGPTRQTGLEFLDQLIGCGLTEINISIDDQHQEWIPLHQVRNAFLACVERKFQCLIGHKATATMKITKAFLEEFFGVELVDWVPDREYSADEACRLISTGPLVPVGPTSRDYPDEELTYLPSWRHSCSSVLKDIVVGADYQLMSCCGIVTKHLPELNLGDIRNARMIDLIDKANRDVILNWIALEGPAAIADFVKEKDPSIKFRDRYVGICHICNEVLTRPDVRTILSEHIDEIIERVRLHRSFLETIRSDPQLMELYCGR